MSNVAPDTVEQWAPMFTKFFKDEQILKPDFMIDTRGHCKLCDAPAGESVKLHVRRHTRELRVWRERKLKVADQARKAGKKAAAKEKSLIEDTIEPTDEDE